MKSVANIWEVAERGCLEDVQAFVKSGVDVNSHGDAKVTPLHHAAEAGQTKVVA